MSRIRNGSLGGWYIRTARMSSVTGSTGWSAVRATRSSSELRKPSWVNRCSPISRSGGRRSVRARRVARSSVTIPTPSNDPRTTTDPATERATSAAALRRRRARAATRPSTARAARGIASRRGSRCVPAPPGCDSTWSRVRARARPSCAAAYTRRTAASRSGWRTGS